RVRQPGDALENLARLGRRRQFLHQRHGRFAGSVQEWQLETHRNGMSRLLAQALELLIGKAHKVERPPDCFGEHLFLGIDRSRYKGSLVIFEEPGDLSWFSDLF